MDILSNTIIVIFALGKCVCVGGGVVIKEKKGRKEGRKTEGRKEGKEINEKLCASL